MDIKNERQGYQKWNTRLWKMKSTVIPWHGQGGKNPCISKRRYLSFFFFLLRMLAIRSIGHGFFSSLSFNNYLQGIFFSQCDIRHWSTRHLKMCPNFLPSDVRWMENNYLSFRFVNICQCLYVCSRHSSSV